MKKEQSYRASVWAIIIDSSYNFLLVKLEWETRDRWDFVKWWMNVWENEKQAILREIWEELWQKFSCELICKSSWYFMYNWSEGLQKEKGYRWQVRQNYWVRYLWWDVHLDSKELSEFIWVSSDKIKEYLKKAWFPDIEIGRFLSDFKELKKIT